jgi:Zn finger protein HypA/HybF involved in hydrogenase expression
VHELGLAQEVCRIAEVHVGADKLPDLVAIGLDVGDGSNVEVSAFEFCLEVVLSQPPFGRATPRITRVPGDDLRVTYLEVDDDDPNHRGA